MDIILQIFGAFFVGSLVGLTQASSKESEYVSARPELPKFVRTLYGKNFSYWRVFFGIPILLAALVPGVVYLLWAQQLDRAAFPAPTLVAIYIVGGFMGYYLRKIMVINIVSRNI
ncbi:Uncharacterised protein [Halioglobus japonicus]|nr:Uncharacterised protein [Halioglobus japonicus]